MIFQILRINICQSLKYQRFTPACQEIQEHIKSLIKISVSLVKQKIKENKWFLKLFRKNSVSFAQVDFAQFPIRVRSAKINQMFTNLIVI